MRSHHAQTHGESIAGTEFTCDWCGSVGRKKYLPDDYEHHFCDQECSSSWRSENLSGEDSHAWNGGREVVECDWCGQDVEKTPAHVRKFENQYCSNECKGKHYSKTNTGENHPRWKGGHEQFDYGPGWKRKRKNRLEYDDYECAVCGLADEKHQEINGNGLDVHHITPVDEFAKGGVVVNPERAHRLDNLISLCRSCHTRWEGIPLRPETE